MPITGLQQITVTGKYLKLDGTPAAGTVTFVPTAVIINTVANEIVFPIPFTATLNSSGAFTLVLPATNDPDLIPTGWVYTVTENITGSSVFRSFDIILPYTETTIDMADVTPAIAQPDIITYALVGHTHSMPLTGTQTTTTRKNIFELQPSTSGVGHYSAGSVGTVFAGTTDYVFDVGYNARKGIVNEPSWTDTIEHDFNEGGFHWLEAYNEFWGMKSPTGTITSKALTANVATIGTLAAHGLAVNDGVKVSTGDLTFDGNWVVASVPTATTFTYARTAANVPSVASGGSIAFVSYRPIFFGIGRQNGELIRTQYLAGSAGFSIREWRTGGEFANIATNSAQFNTEELVLRSAGGAPLPQIRAEVGSTPYFTMLAAATYLTVFDIGTTRAAWFSSLQGGGLGIGNDGNGGAKLWVENLTGATALNVVLVQARTGQTGNLQGWRTLPSDGITTRIDKDAYFITSKIAAPADSALGANDVALWFDNTPSTGGLRIKGKDSAGVVVSALGVSGVTVTPAASAVALIVKAAATQTGDLQQWQNNVATVSRVTANGSLGLGIAPTDTARLEVQPVVGATPTAIFRSGRIAGDATVNQNIVEFWSHDKLNTRALGALDYLGRWLVNPGAIASFGPSTFDASFFIGTRVASGGGLVMRGLAAQTGDLLRAEISDGTLVTRLNKVGTFMTRQTAAPADADLVAGELSLWFDSTNGAAKLMVKAKQADGTVRTGSVALA